MYIYKMHIFTSKTLTVHAMCTYAPCNITRHTYVPLLLTKTLAYVAFITTGTLYLKNNLREEIFWFLASELAVHGHWVLGVAEWNRLHHGSLFRSRFSSSVIRLTLGASFSVVKTYQQLSDPRVALEKASRENRAKQFAPVAIRPCRLNS